MSSFSSAASFFSICERRTEEDEDGRKEKEAWSRHCKSFSPGVPQKKRATGPQEQVLHPQLALRTARAAGEHRVLFPSGAVRLLFLAGCICFLWDTKGRNLEGATFLSSLEMDLVEFSLIA